MNEYPWQVMVYFIEQIKPVSYVGLVSPGRDVPFCGGSILSSTTIITAAHCTRGKSVTSFEVLVGEHDLAVDDGQERVAVCSKEEHPEYIRSLH